jgi:hypothetical protein
VGKATAHGRAGLVVAVVATVALLASACAAGGDGARVDGSVPSTRSTTEPSTVPAMITADDIAIAHTPPGGYVELPPPVLEACTEPLVAGAPDLRGWWEVVEVEVEGALDPAHRALGGRQRIEQCGDRLVVTAAGIVHDMRPVGVPVEITRRPDGGQVVWGYLGFTARLDRLGPPEDEPPPT